MNGAIVAAVVVVCTIILAYYFLASKGAGGACSPPCPDGCACSAGQCEPATPGGCCPACGANATCSGGQCVSKCAAANCPSGCSCDTASGECVPATPGGCCPACGSGETCVNGACASNSSCLVTKCGAGCVCGADGACGPATAGGCCPACGAGEICKNGSCVANSGCGALGCPDGCVCNPDGTCSAATAGSCCPACGANEKCANGACVPLNSCTNASACPDGLGCVFGASSYGTCGQCSADDECAPAHKRCSPAGTCVDCTSNSDCSAGEVCRSDGSCGACQEQSDCEALACLAGQCAACAVDADCGGNMVCVSGANQRGAPPPNSCRQPVAASNPAVIRSRGPQTAGWAIGMTISAPIARRMWTAALKPFAPNGANGVYNQLSISLITPASYTATKFQCYGQTELLYWINLVGAPGVPPGDWIGLGTDTGKALAYFGQLDPSWQFLSGYVWIYDNGLLLCCCKTYALVASPSGALSIAAYSSSLASNPYALWDIQPYPSSVGPPDAPAAGLPAFSALPALDAPQAEFDADQYRQGGPGAFFEGA
jgi:hypothetical protein